MNNAARLPYAMKIFTFFSYGVAYFASTLSFAQTTWSIESYPDEPGFVYRSDGMLRRLADIPFGLKSMSKSNCPDTGLPVYTYALEGEIVHSPFTGRTYLQGDTGYFGAKERDSLGNITRFGGDALKKDLPPLTASMLIDPTNLPNKAFLSIPGHLNQHYHFAAKNWARFYPLLSATMGEEWQRDFQRAVSAYQELGRPSDGFRKYDPLSVPHNLIGEPGELLGGNRKDGGTENHKIMWRSSALVYAQQFPPGTFISGYERDTAKMILEGYFVDFLERVMTYGNGEYDSQIYYPHSIESLLNLYDFSNDSQIKATAKGLLDYFLATYALKVYDGAIAGAQKRGSKEINTEGEMFHHLHVWFGNPSVHDANFVSSLHQLTSSYRPNRSIVDLYKKNIDLPFEAEIARPDYHSTEANRFHEYFYAGKSYGMGSIYMNHVDNAGQQVVWSLVVKGKSHPLTFGGGHPFHKAPGGHSPYTQTLQKEGMIIVASAPTQGNDKSDVRANADRLHWGKPHLSSLLPPTNQAGSLEEFFEQATFQAATWLFVPKHLDEIKELDGSVFFAVNRTYISVSPFNNAYYWIRSQDHASVSSKTIRDLLGKFDILVVPGEFSGYVLEVTERDAYLSFENFIKHSMQRQLNVNNDSRSVKATSLAGTSLEMTYQADQLKAAGKINGKALHFGNWADGGVYKSPALVVKSGIMNLSSNGTGYSMRLTNGKIDYKEIK